MHPLSRVWRPTGHGWLPAAGLGAQLWTVALFQLVGAPEAEREKRWGQDEDGRLVPHYARSGRSLAAAAHTAVSGACAL